MLDREARKPQIAGISLLDPCRGRPKGELREILQEAVVQLRGGRALEEATQRHKGERRGPSAAHRRAPRTVHTTAASVPSLLPSRSHWQAVSRRE